MAIHLRSEEELNNVYRATRMLLLCALLATPLAAQNYAPDWQSLDSRPNHPADLYMLGQGLLKSGDSAGAIGRWRRVIEITPDHAQALYNLSRLLTKSAPEEVKRPQARFETLQATQHIMNRAQTLGNFALTSAAVRLAASNRTTEGRPPTLRECSTLPLLRKDLGLISGRSGDLKNGLAESLRHKSSRPRALTLSRQSA
jgi:hypothetical protein